MNCPYATLGVSERSTQEEIKRAYRQRARETHPDTTKADTAQEFIQVKNAYTKALSILMDETHLEDSYETIPYMTVPLSEYRDIQCRCGTIYENTNEIGTVECIACSHYIEIVQDS